MCCLALAMAFAGCGANTQNETTDSTPTEQSANTDNAVASDETQNTEGFDNTESTGNKLSSIFLQQERQKLLLKRYSPNSVQTFLKLCRLKHILPQICATTIPAQERAWNAKTSFLAEACEDLFYQMIHRLESAGELSKETVFIDGTKLEACANKYTFVWRKSVGKWEQKMFQKIQEAVRLINQEYIKSFCITEESRTQDLQENCYFLEEYCKDQNIVFVHGRGKRKSREQRYLELFRRFLERQMVYDWHSASFQGRNNYCKTDPDATFMHMKDDHMRNAQLKPGYNVQIGVDSEYIVAADIFQDRNDVWTLVPFLKTMEEKLGFGYPSVTADSGYESEEGYSYLRETKQKPYIKPQTYEKWKKRSFKKDISKGENMEYDEKTDTYTCHAGKNLKPLFIRKQKSKSGYQSEVTVYECEDCTSCPHKEKCTKAKGNKRLYLSKSFLEKRQESYENILTRDFCFEGKER